MSASHKVLRACRVNGKASILLVCDHASRALPRGRLARELGYERPSSALSRSSTSSRPSTLSREVLGSHRAYDPGAEALTLKLSERLEAPAVFGAYSRLVIDLNRSIGRADSAIVCADGVAIPPPSEAEYRARVDELFLPYHDYIERLIGLRQRASKPFLLLVAVHSFTPCLDTAPYARGRAMACGVLWSRSRDSAVRVARQLAESTKESIALNKPYSGKREGYTIKRHGELSDTAALAIEVRSDKIESEEQQNFWTDRLAAAFEAEVSKLERAPLSKAR